MKTPLLLVFTATLLGMSISTESTRSAFPANPPSGQYVLCTYDEAGNRITRSVETGLRSQDSDNTSSPLYRPQVDSINTSTPTPINVKGTVL